MKTKLAIFDWDGTLMDSVPRIVVAMQRAAKDIGIPVFYAPEVRNIVGLGLPEAIETLAPSLNDTQARQLRESYIAHFVAYEESAPAPPLFNGVHEGMTVLHQQGIQLAVATGKSEKGLRRAFSHEPALAELMSAFQTADKTRSKPNPLMLEKILADLNVDPEEAVMVGDSEYDMEMARNARMKGIGVSWGVHSEERLKAKGAAMVVSDFSAIVSYLCEDI